MIIAEMPKSTGLYCAGETEFTGASLWEFCDGVGTRCVWSGEISSEDKLNELVAGWKQEHRNRLVEQAFTPSWRPHMVALDNRHTGDTYVVDVDKFKPFISLR